jgi:hypothetical protein
MKNNIEQFPAGFKPVKLKPCPFCGNTMPIVRHNAPSSDTQPWPHVYCLECGVGHTTIKLWNTRTK